VAGLVRAIPIVPLDVSGMAEAVELVDHLGDRCQFYKVGNELFTACGPSIVREIRARGRDVFLDLKFHDIPNTVAAGVRNAAALGARLVTVHATGGRAMLDAAVAAAAGVHGVVCSGREAPLVRARFADRLATLVPGIRAAGGPVHDQTRVVTPREAVAAGARYVIIGRMVTAAADRRAAMDDVLAQLA
jgi:orotidine-5'-phosphate decarboxylase